MKFAGIKIGNVIVDIRVIEGWRTVYLAAFSPDHVEAHALGELFAKVPVTQNPGETIEQAFDRALLELRHEVYDKAASFRVPQQTQNKRGFASAIRHLLNFKKSEYLI